MSLQEPTLPTSPPSSVKLLEGRQDSFPTADHNKTMSSSVQTSGKPPSGSKRKGQSPKEEDLLIQSPSISKTNRTSATSKISPSEEEAVRIFVQEVEADEKFPASPCLRCYPWKMSRQQLLSPGYHHHLCSVGDYLRSKNSKD